MFAVIQTGGKQYRVAPGTRLSVETVDGAPGERVTFSSVLLTHDGKETAVGTPMVPKASVEAVVRRNVRGERKIVFRYHSKTRYRKFKTHRQPATEIEVTKINH